MTLETSYTELNLFNYTTFCVFFCVFSRVCSMVHAYFRLGLFKWGLRSTPQGFELEKDYSNDLSTFGYMFFYKLTNMANNKKILIQCF